MSETQRREDSRLESDDELACIDCGAICGYFPMVMHGYDRCPECHLDHEREKLMNIFGTLETSEAMLSWDANPYEGVEVPETDA